MNNSKIIVTGNNNIFNLGNNNIVPENKKEHHSFFQNIASILKKIMFFIKKI